MAMSQSKLATELQNLTPSTSEASAISVLSTAYGNYASDAESNSVQILSAGVTAGKAAMSSALVGMNQSGQGSTKWQAAIQAFWAAAALPAYFTGSIACTPPPNSGLKAKLDPTFSANTSGNKSLVDSTSAIAADMHSEAITGGTCTFPGPSVFPIV